MIKNENINQIIKAMKKLIVTLLYARKAQCAIEDNSSISQLPEQTASNEWEFKTEDIEDEEDFEEAIRAHFETWNIPTNEYTIEY